MPRSPDAVPNALGCLVALALLFVVELATLATAVVGDLLTRKP